MQCVSPYIHFVAGAVYDRAEMNSGMRAVPDRANFQQSRRIHRASLLDDVTSRRVELGSVWLLLERGARGVITSPWIRDNRDNGQVVHAKIGMAGEVLGKRCVFGINGPACQK